MFSAPLPCLLLSCLLLLLLPSFLLSSLAQQLISEYNKLRLKALDRRRDFQIQREVRCACMEGRDTEAGREAGRDAEAKRDGEERQGRCSRGRESMR